MGYEVSLIKDRFLNTINCPPVRLSLQGAHIDAFGNGLDSVNPCGEVRIGLNPLIDRPTCYTRLFRGELHRPALRIDP